MSNAYHNEPFPLSVERVISGVEGNTTVIPVGLNGREIRISNWDDGRVSVDCVPGVRSLADLKTLISFHRRRKYKLFSFPVRDPLDYEVARGTEGSFAVGDGTAGPFQLTKTYPDSSNSDVRRITKPEPASVKIYVGGVLKTEGTDYTLDYLTGLVTFLSGHFPSSSAVIEWEGRFYVPVRFADDKLPVGEFFLNMIWDVATSQNLVTAAAGEISPILLVEDMGA
jgi:uncharacterized protein (TIGR02217 family)